MKSRLVSIILPVYNAEQYVAKAIESVLGQTYPEWELIIVNDGSTDNSKKVCEGFDDERISVLTQNNKGVSAARNVGLKRLKGEYFCFLDADDALTPNSIESRLSLFLTDPGLMFVDGAVEIRNKDMTSVMEIRAQHFSGIPLDALLNIDNSVFFGPTWMVRKRAGVNYQFKEGLTHGEDLLFYISIAHLGRYRAVKDVVYLYRQGNLSAMSDLKGLWEGYKAISKELGSIPTVNRTQKQLFKRKITSIMFKSYLGVFKPFKALGVVWDYYKL
ncbi:MAG: glycosyltransferase family 2 protein [Marinoscillum sp.]